MKKFLLLVALLMTAPLPATAVDRSIASVDSFTEVFSANRGQRMVFLNQYGITKTKKGYEAEVLFAESTSAKLSHQGNDIPVWVVGFDCQGWVEVVGENTHSYDPDAGLTTKRSEYRYGTRNLPRRLPIPEAKEALEKMVCGGSTRIIGPSYTSAYEANNLLFDYTLARDFEYTRLALNALLKRANKEYEASAVAAGRCEAYDEGIKEAHYEGYRMIQYADWRTDATAHLAQATHELDYFHGEEWARSENRLHFWSARAEVFKALEGLDKCVAKEKQATP